MSEEKSEFNEWALVELMGRQRIVGKVSEATIAGSAFIRVDVPAVDNEKAFTRFFTPPAIYAISPVDEALALQMVLKIRNVPVSRYELPEITEKVLSQADANFKEGFERQQADQFDTPV